MALTGWLPAAQQKLYYVGRSRHVIVGRCIMYHNVRVTSLVGGDVEERASMVAIAANTGWFVRAQEAVIL